MSLRYSVVQPPLRAATERDRFAARDSSKVRCRNWEQAYVVARANATPLVPIKAYHPLPSWTSHSRGTPVASARTSQTAHTQ